MNKVSTMNDRIMRHHVWNRVEVRAYARVTLRVSGLVLDRVWHDPAVVLTMRGPLRASLRQRLADA